MEESTTDLSGYIGRVSDLPTNWGFYGKYYRVQCLYLQTAGLRGLSANQRLVAGQGPTR